MEQELKNKILKEIKKTGFPTELEIAQILKKDKWIIEQNITYFDFEIQKSREIDIVATKHFTYPVGNINGVFFTINLIIEIKKATQRPWVVFTTPLKGFANLGFNILHFGKNFSTKTFETDSFIKNYPRQKITSIGVSFYEAFKSVEEPNKIYEAVMTAVKAAFYERKKITSPNGMVLEYIDLEPVEEHPFDPKRGQFLDVFIPVILVNGLLCKGYLLENGDIDVVESDFLPLEVSYSKPPYGEQIYYPELIRKEYFTEFLSSVNNWGISVIDSWKTKLKNTKH